MTESGPGVGYVDNTGIFYKLHFCHIVNHLKLLPHTILIFKDPKEGGFENISGNNENAGYQHFLLSHTVSKPVKEKYHPLPHTEIFVYQSGQS